MDVREFKKYLDHATQCGQSVPPDCVFLYYWRELYVASQDIDTVLGGLRWAVLIGGLIMERNV